MFWPVPGYLSSDPSKKPALEVVPPFLAYVQAVSRLNRFRRNVAKRSIRVHGLNDLAFKALHLGFHQFNEAVPGEIHLAYVEAKRLRNVMG